MLRADKAFFVAQPMRRFRARPFADCDSPFPASITLFTDDGTGSLCEYDLVIVAKHKTGRNRMMFAASNGSALDSDRAIKVFLRSRNIDPVSFKAFAK